jgi:DNA-binding transcriptional ArsR family regulator
MTENPAIFFKMATLFKALSDENRLRIVFCLLSSFPKSLTVSEIVQKLAISQPLTSHHLKELRYSGIVSSRRKGPFIHYQLISGDILNILQEAFAWIENCGGRDDDLPQDIRKRLMEKKLQTTGRNHV